MVEISFYDREREVERLLSILANRPDMITFIYGPINSGKTELLNHLINRLDERYVVFYINLRERMVASFKDFIEALFEVGDKRWKRKDIIKKLLSSIARFNGIPISVEDVESIFGEERPRDAFRYIVEVVKEVRKRGKMPVLIVDELQKVRDVRVDGFLIYELFNLFVRLSKEMHACHVFAVSSDSLFIERVYSEAMLYGRCRYILVDDFDLETAREFLKNHGFNEREVKVAIKYFGGKPMYLVEAIKNRESLEEFCSEVLKIRVRQVKDFLYSLDEEMHERVLRLFERFRENEVVKYEMLTEEMRMCVRNNILFLDPLNSIVKPQSRIELLAIREVLEEGK